MGIRWQRLTEADVERLTRVCNLDETERKILELRRVGTVSDIIADKIGYSRSQMFILSKKLMYKILKEL
jgi:transcriptional regulator